MEFTGWMLDVARDQSPTEEWLNEVAERSRSAGYNALGLYLEHRYAYPSAPWAASEGCLTPAVVNRLVGGFQSAGLRIIPFLNTLGHMEGFIRSQGGQSLAEGPIGWSLQMCPSRPECVAFARGLVEDALAVFEDEWVHLGGDETRLLGHCPLCAERVAKAGKAGLYGAYYGALCRWLLERGRRPCLWGDMLLKHPEAMAALPRETVIFDWQYFNRPRESSAKFRAAGFDVVCCPSIQTYNSGWCFLDATRQNIDEHDEDARTLGALGVLVTTWEFTYFSAYDGILPILYAAGRRLSRNEDWGGALRAEGGAPYARIAALLGEQVPAAVPFLAPGTWRTLRDRLVIRQNPFELWRAWREEAGGAAGDALLRLCDEGDAILAGDGGLSARQAAALRVAIDVHRAGVLFTRHAQRAFQKYMDADLRGTVVAFGHAAEALCLLEGPLSEVAANGGSRADPQRLQRLLEKVRQAVRRIEDLPANATHRPAFETLVADGYISGDQANWLTGDLPPYRPD